MQTIDDLVKDYYGRVRPNGSLGSFVPSDKSADFDWHFITPEIIQDKVVLDLGCCYPNDALHFGSYAKEWYSIDFCEEVIKKCQAMNFPDHVHFLHMDMRTLKFFHQTFDIVLDMSSGDHLSLSDLKKCVKEVFRVLKPGGTFFMTYANKEYFEQYEYFGRDFGYWRCEHPDFIEDVLKNAGFEITTHENHTARAFISGRKP